MRRNQELLVLFISLSWILPNIVAQSAPAPDNDEYTLRSPKVTYRVGLKEIFVGNWKTNWYRAYETCRSLGMQMVTIESPEDNRKLWDFLSSKGLGDAWLGGTDLGHEGQWMWFPTGKFFGYKRWSPNNPDNFSGTQHCLKFWTNYPSFWDDDDCRQDNYFLCEAVECSYTIHIRPSIVLQQNLEPAASLQGLDEIFGGGPGQ